MLRPVFHFALATGVVATALFGCESTQGGTDGSAPPIGEEPKTSANISIGTDPKDLPDPALEAEGQKAGSTAAPGATLPKDGEEVAVLDTTQGKIILKFFPKEAPGHVKNFKDLSKKGFYDGTKFHRVIPGFMIQGGDPFTKTGKGRVGTGDPGYKIKAEFNPIKHKRGILSMARSQDPDSAGSQFFIMHGDNAGLDGQYTAFGQVVSGMDVVDKIVALPTIGDQVADRDQAEIKSAKIVKWPVK